MSDVAQELQEILKELESISQYKHNSKCGLSHEKTQKFKATQTEDELTQIVYLVDSHASHLRERAAMRYQRLTSVPSKDETNEALYLLRDIINPKCCTGVSDAISELKSQVTNLPEEWTVVQITRPYNPLEELNLDPKKYFTDSLYITVFNCGQRKIDPFLIRVDSPVVNGSKLELCQLLMDTLEEHSARLMSTTGLKFFKNHKEKQEYHAKAENTESRLKDVIKNAEENWLCEWRCLLIGKFKNKAIDQHIKTELGEILNQQLKGVQLPQRSIELLFHLTKGASYLTRDEVFRGVQYCLKDSCDLSTIKEIVKFLKELNISFCNKFLDVTRHPVILVVDEALDSFPWEMMRVLENQPVSRVPSVHFVYFLFKVHENDIQEGCKIVKNYENGKFIVNPDGDLTKMSARMLSFYRYWLPTWSGIENQKPSNSEFTEILKNADIFAYNGHGNGTHILPVETLQKLKLEAVVLLFGCASTRINRLGPQVGTWGSYHMFLISRCPCVLGMLWPITDIHTDLFTVELLSKWIPSDAPIPWTDVDKTSWIQAVKIQPFTAKNKTTPIENPNNLELLRVLSQCKSYMEHYFTKAACVVRGIPVKIQPK